MQLVGDINQEVKENVILHLTNVRTDDLTQVRALAHSNGVVLDETSAAPNLGAGTKWIRAYGLRKEIVAMMEDREFQKLKIALIVSNNNGKTR